jgi:hypothetical protein
MVAAGSKALRIAEPGLDGTIGQCGIVHRLA